MKMLGSYDGQRFYLPVMDRQRGLNCAKKKRIYGYHDGYVIVAHGTIHSRGVPSPGPSFSLSALFFSLVLTLWLLIYAFFSFFYFCLLQSRGIRRLDEYLLARRGGVFLLAFFPFITLSSLGYFRIVLFFSGSCIMVLQLVCSSVQKWELCSVELATFFWTPIQTQCFFP